MELTELSKGLKKIGICLSGIVIFGLLSSFIGFLFDSRSSSTKMAHKICAQIGKKINKKYGLRFMGISEQGSDGKYVTIGLELSCKRILTKDEGRVLILHCAHDALIAFNSDPDFKQYMMNVPFSNDNIIINIYARSPETFTVYYPDITGFTFFNNVLRYYTKLPDKNGFYTKEEETYEEALKIVEAQHRGDLPFARGN